MKSPKQLSLEKKIRQLLAGKSLLAAETIFADPEVQSLQDYANTVSIKRLHYNDHGPVHMRKVLLNSLLLIDLLGRAGIPLSLESEEIGTLEDSRVAVLIAACLHDVGMTIGREDHENMAVSLVLPILDRLLAKLYPGDFNMRVILRSLIVECIVGHMGTQHIHSLEAGIVLVADGCDMEQGRARIPMMLETESKMGDIHKYSSSAVESVVIEKGSQKPVAITVRMKESVGFFQVEEVLLKKINASTIKPYLELNAGVTGQGMKRYL
jgi:uncharacterized protein